MSRIGRLPVTVPSGVDVTIDGQDVKVNGPKGELALTVTAPISVARGDEGAIEVSRPNDERESRSLHGLTRSLIANMVEGVTKGFEKKLEINGVGYRAAVQGKNLQLALGYSHDVVYAIPEGITIAVPKPTEITITGTDSQRVGQVAAEIAEKHGIRIANVFHAGDGNLHPIILFDAKKPGDLEKAKRAGDEILEVCVTEGGTITGEHGVGLAKKAFLKQQLGDDSYALLKTIKRSLDPEGLLNPGKIFD